MSYPPEPPHPFHIPTQIMQSGVLIQNIFVGFVFRGGFPIDPEHIFMHFQAFTTGTDSTGGGFEHGNP